MSIQLNAILQQGHQVASGLSKHSPYPAGTIAIQQPFFAALGLDLSEYYPATLNLNIHPNEFTLQQADYHFKQVHWAEGFEAEDFSFVKCSVGFAQQHYKALIYYPHPETKRRHFQPNTMLEILAPYIANMHYGARLTLQLDAHKIAIKSAHNLKLR